MCGLKHIKRAKDNYATSVTPFVGVWIETNTHLCLNNLRFVTPFVGVWIETAGTHAPVYEKAVTPFVGVWIETALSL